MVHVGSRGAAVLGKFLAAKEKRGVVVSEVGV